GKYVHNIVFDSEQIAVLIGNDVPRIINEVLAVFILLFIIGINSPVILLFSLASVVIYIFLGHYFSKRVKKATKDVQRTKSDLIIHMEEGVASTREVIAYHRMKWEKAIYDRVFQSYFHAVMKEGKVVKDRKSTRLNSSHVSTSYAVFCLKKKIKRVVKDHK